MTIRKEINNIAEYHAGTLDEGEPVYSAWGTTSPDAFVNEYWGALTPGKRAASGSNEPPTQERPEPQAASPQNKCRHKFDILEYPSATNENYLFFCQFCLKIKEKKPPWIKEGPISV